ncbi:MAG TPA: phosphoglycerate dehydrogenase [Gemmatimonadaceae bacterium]|jgi:D-3-phosphoglycerate dehydrogenase|nr:phosphoglycerate dehydrogenase [Gemmatimonadaceae bacterium]
MTRFRVLVTDEVDPRGVELLRAEPTLDVNEQPTRPWQELRGEIGEYDAFVGRSATRLPAELLRDAKRLRVIGRAGVGTDNIDLSAATALGIAVINAPSGNTIAVAELFFGALLSFVRHLPDAFESMRAGRWDRSDLLGTELSGRSIGIVGLGRIGGEVATRARAFNMTVVAYDPYVQRDRFELFRAERAERLSDLLRRADVLTVHTPLTDETRGIIDADALAQVSRGAIVANFARGGIIDETALAGALAENRLAGALLDVYTTEPLPADHPLRRANNVLLTPHLGASTVEGQRNVAVDVCIAVRDALLSGQLSGAVNLAGVDRARWRDLRGALYLARQEAAIARAMLAERGTKAPEQLTLHFGRQFIGADSLLGSAAAEGLLAAIMNNDRVNIVNARERATERGIALATVALPPNEEPYAVRVTVSGDGRQLSIGGTATPGAAPRITRIGDFKVDVAPRRTLVVLTNADVPGVIGQVGTVLGSAGINIAEYHQARMTQGGEALAAISVDGTVSEQVRRRLLEVASVRSATVVEGDGQDADIFE